MRFFNPSSMLAAVVPAALLALSGCGGAANSSPGFILNVQGDDPLDYSEEEGPEPQVTLVREFNRDSRQYLADALEAMFGTPDDPFVFRESGLDLRKIRMASGPVGGVSQAVKKENRTKWSKQLGDLRPLVAERDKAAKDAAAQLAAETKAHGGPLEAAKAALATETKARSGPRDEAQKQLDDAKKKLDAEKAAREPTVKAAEKALEDAKKAVEDKRSSPETAATLLDESNAKLADLLAPLEAAVTKAQTALDASNRELVMQLQPFADAVKAAETAVAERKKELDAQLKPFVDDVAAKQKDLDDKLAPTVAAKAKADAEYGETKGAVDDLELQVNASFVPQKGLYRQHCAHCHGVTGDGAGPTAAFLYPYPRDYRDGVFKFKSTEQADKPTTADLRRILVDGIPDTAMPTVGLLPADEIDALVEYVKYLSMRGEVEQTLKKLKFDPLRDGVSDAATLAAAKEGLVASRAFLVQEALATVAESWAAAEEPGKVINPGEPPKPPTDRTAWLNAGRELFMGNVGQCASCHGNNGLGDGRKPTEPLYDFWNKPKSEIEKNRLAAAAKDDAKAEERAARLTASYALPLQEQQPRNLRLNRYRFGRSPLDIYRRIYTGIRGTEMPGAKGKLTDQQIWQLVDYVQTLPYLDDDGNMSSPHGDAHAGHADAAHAGHGPAPPAAATPESQ